MIKISKDQKKIHSGLAVSPGLGHNIIIRHITEVMALSWLVELTLIKFIIINLHLLTKFSQLCHVVYHVQPIVMDSVNFGDLSYNQLLSQTLLTAQLMFQFLRTYYSVTLTSKGARRSGLIVQAHDVEDKISRQNCDIFLQDDTNSGWELGQPCQLLLKSVPVRAGRLW